MTTSRTPRLLRMGALALAVGVLAACGSSTDDGGSDGGAFSFTDDLGVEIELDAMPERLVVQSSMAAALTDLGLGDKIVGVFGPLRDAEGDIDAQAKGLDVDAVEDVTDASEYGNVEVEDLAALNPDLIVTMSFLDDDLWYLNDATADTLRKQYQILTVSFDGKTLEESVDSVDRAGEALGADLDSEQVTQAKADFEDASTAVQAAGEALGDDADIVVASAATEAYYVTNPEVSQDLNYLVEELGLPITVPEDPDPEGYFETLSWENADKYPADVIMWDARIGTAGLDLMKQQPVFAELEASQNDAFIEWALVAPPSYRAYADIFAGLAEDLEGFAS